MRGAPERNIVRASIASAAMGIVVVVLEVFSRGAASSVLADIGTLTPVALVYKPLYWRGNVARAWRRVRLIEALPGFFRLAKTFGFEPLELQGHRCFDDRSQVGARHEVTESLELLMELGTRGEPDSVARRRERLHHRGLHRGFTRCDRIRGRIRHSHCVWRQLGWSRGLLRLTRCRELPHRASDVRLWRNLGNQLQDFLFGLVLRLGQELVTIGLRENRRELCDSAQVKSPVLEHRQ